MSTSSAPKMNFAEKYFAVTDGASPSVTKPAEVTTTLTQGGIV